MSKGMYLCALVWFIVVVDLVVFGTGCKMDPTSVAHPSGTWVYLVYDETCAGSITPTMTNEELLDIAKWCREEYTKH